MFYVEVTSRRETATSPLSSCDSNLMAKSCPLHLGQDHTKHKAAAPTVTQHRSFSTPQFIALKLLYKLLYF